MSYEILVPLGLDPEGREVRAKNAEKGIEYRCPSCYGELVLRKGSLRRVHFAHKVIPENCDFIYETENHLRAKWAVVKAIEQGAAVFFRRRCQRCGTHITQPLPKSVTRAVLEYPLPSGHRADIALLDQADNLLAVLEIFAPHRIDEEKTKVLAEIPWAEIEAETILASNEWPLLVDHFKPAVCPKCLQIKKYGALRPLTGNFRRFVQCPLEKGQMVTAVDRCSRCQYLVEVKPNGIFCYGRSGYDAGS